MTKYNALAITFYTEYPGAELIIPGNVALGAGLPLEACPPSVVRKWRKHLDLFSSVWHKLSSARKVVLNAVRAMIEDSGGRCHH